MNYPAWKISVLTQFASVFLHLVLFTGVAVLWQTPVGYSLQQGQGGAAGRASPRGIQAELQLNAAPQPVSQPVLPAEKTPVAETAEVQLPPKTPAVAAPEVKAPTPTAPPAPAISHVQHAEPSSPGSAGTQTAGATASGNGGAQSAARPDLLHNPPPLYPQEAREKGQQGRVVLRATVSDRGRTMDIRVLQSSGYDALDQAAITAVKQWRFVPATRAGIKVSDQVDLPFSFSLKD